MDWALVERLRAALREGPPVRLAVLFGSAATGTSRADSDLDVAVLPVDPAFDTRQEGELGRRLGPAGGADVDVIRLDELVSTLLQWEVATTGVPLIEAAPGEFAKFRARAAAEFIDFAPALAHYGERFRRRLVEQGRSR